MTEKPDDSLKDKIAKLDHFAKNDPFFSTFKASSDQLADPPSFLTDKFDPLPIVISDSQVRTTPTTKAADSQPHSDCIPDRFVPTSNEHRKYDRPPDRPTQMPVDSAKPHFRSDRFDGRPQDPFARDSSCSSDQAVKPDPRSMVDFPPLHINDLFRRRSPERFPDPPPTRDAMGSQRFDRAMEPLPSPSASRPGEQFHLHKPHENHGISYPPPVRNTVRPTSENRPNQPDNSRPIVKPTTTFPMANPPRRADDHARPFQAEPTSAAASTGNMPKFFDCGCDVRTFVDLYKVKNKSYAETQVGRFNWIKRHLVKRIK